jgi:hypothetical protein
MKKLLLILSPFLFLSLKCNQRCGCDIPTPSSEVDLVFKPNFNNKPFVINQIYDINGKKVRFTRLSFLLTETCPKASISSGSCGSNAYLVDLSNLDDSTKSSKGQTQRISQAIAGNMKVVQLGVGVAKNLNANLPKDFPNTNPLSDAGLYWTDWKSYIFLKIEGLMDKDGDGKFETGITLHTGGDDSFRSIVFDKTFQVGGSTIEIVNFDLNINTLLRGIDLATVNSTHQTGDKPTMLKIMDNMTDAIILK